MRYVHLAPFFKCKLRFAATVYKAILAKTEIICPKNVRAKVAMDFT